MRFGAHSQMFVHEFDASAATLFDDAERWGLDLLEIHVGDPHTFPVREVRAALASSRVDVVLGTALQQHNSPVSDDPQIRASAWDHLRSCIDLASELGAPKICGGLHSANGYFVGRARTSEEWARSVDFLRVAGAYAAERNVTLTVEPVSRYSGYFLNSADDGIALVDAVDSPAVRLQLDTWHMNIEESDPAAAIREAGPRLQHVHLVESNRGIPGTGQVPWKRIFSALLDIGYDDTCVFEFFPVSLPAMAVRTHTWRDLGSSIDVVTDGLRRMRSVLDEVTFSRGL